MSQVRSIQLRNFKSSTLSTQTYTKGEVFYDESNETLRVFDGVTRGGFPLLRADLSNASGNVGGVTVSTTPPATATLGSLWFNSNTGALYIYYTDSQGSKWIQPILNPAIVLDVGYTLPVATYTILGGVIPDNNTITINSSGVITYVPTGTFNDTLLNASTTVQHYSEQVVNFVNSSGTVNHNWSSGTGRYTHNQPSGNFTANFINMPVTNNRAITITLTVVQPSSTAYLPTTLQVEGVAQPINWLNGIVPTGTVNGIDVVQFTLLRLVDYWTVFGGVQNTGLASGSSPTYSITPNTTSISKGAGVTYTVTTTNVPNGTVLYWTTSGTMLSTDFTDVVSAGTVTITNNVGSIGRATSATTPNTPKTMYLQIRVGSANGTVVATAAVVTIN
jgi:hypothetical protein